MLFLAGTILEEQSIETMGPINVVGLERSAGHRISRVTDDPRGTSFLFQRIAVAIQRFTAVIFQILSTIPMTTPQAFRSTPIELNFL